MRNLIFALAIACAFCVSSTAFAATNADLCEANGGSWVPGQGNSQNIGSCVGGNTGGDTGGDGGSGGSGGTGGQGGAGGFAAQGQQQGQVGINEQSQLGVNVLENEVENDSFSFSGVNRSGNSEVGNGFGNFSPEAAATAFGAQGQKQGQFGVNANDTEVDTDIEVDNTAVTTDVSSNKQGQKQTNGDFSGDIFDARDQSVTTYEAAKIPVNSAPASISGSCGQGVGFTNDNASFSVASSNPVCDLLNVAEGYAALGQMDAAVSTVAQAEKAARLRAFWGGVRQCLTLGLL